MTQWLMLTEEIFVEDEELRSQKKAGIIFKRQNQKDEKEVFF